MPAVSLQNVTKTYGDVLALDAVDLNIENGEFCVIVGPSGSGKTTLLNILAGFIKPDNGVVKVDGKTVNHLSSRERNIGMVFQDVGLFSHLSARKNISFGLDIKRVGRREIDERVEEIASRLKISKLLDKKPAMLSGGEAQRVAIGRALVSNPSFFIFDEPLGNLDADLKMEMLTEIKRLHIKLKKTFIYVTHDQEQALSAASKVVIMRKGHILQEGHPRDIYTDPRNIFVAEFFGVPAMNLINGTIVPNGSKSLFKGAGLTVPLKGTYQEKETEVVLGIRPSDVIVGKKGGGFGSGTVRSVEHLGEKNQIFIDMDGISVIGITAPDIRPEQDDSVSISLREDKIYLFEKDGGGRISLGKET
jgi:multiple sugar transport system ATP-binding protein